MKLSRSTGGFAHPILLVVVLVGIVGLIAYSGHRVVTQNSKARQSGDTATQLPILITDESSNEELAGTSSVNISSAGTAAAEAGQQAYSGSAQSLPATKNVSTQYNVSTATGSLNQLLHEVRTKDFSSALYFITPRLMFSAYDLVNSQNLNDFAQNCLLNNVCKTLVVTDIVINPEHIIESECHGESYAVECKKISTTVAIKDGKLITEYYKTVGYGHHKVAVYMLRGSGSPNWVADKITVDNFTL